MRYPAVAMLPTWRTEHQARILHLLLTHPDTDYSLTDIADATGVAYATTHTETTRLLDAALVTERRVGRSRLIRANTAHPATEHLTALAYLTFGAKESVTEHFADIGAHTVLIFGSWASRYLGHPGPPPGDVDVLVLAAPDDRRHVRTRAYAAARAAEADLGLDVHVQVMNTSAWDDLDDQLIADIRASDYLIVHTIAPEEPSPGR